MLTWLFINVALTFVALLFIGVNDSAPHRLRFFAGFVALVAWLVPWPLSPDLLPANVFSVELSRIERAVEANSMRMVGLSPVVVASGAMPAPRASLPSSVLELCFLMLTLVGCVLFAWKLVAHRWLLRGLELGGEDASWLWARAGLAPVCPIGVQREVAGAFASGLLHPRIWVHDDLVQSPQLATLLRHEVAHIRQHDNWYLFVITLVERLFWWNPLVWYLGRSTRELQELSCDEACRRADADYPAQLAQLMLDSARSTARRPPILALGANIFSDPNPNVKRIQRLQRNYPMRTRHILGAAVTAISALFTVNLVTAQPGAAQAVAGERVPGGGGIDRFAGGTYLPGMNARGVTPRRFVMVHVVNGERVLTMNFTEAPLPDVLMPIVNVVSGGGKFIGVAQVRSLEGGMEATSELTTEQLLEELDAAGGAASWGEEKRVVSFRPRMLVTDQLVLEYPDAADRILSVDLTAVTVDQALDAISEVSGCNIFRNDDTIVVDYCEE